MAVNVSDMWPAETAGSFEGRVPAGRNVKQELSALGPGKGAQTSRGLRRRGMILKVAARLFAEHGFDGVSINDIGVAAGITGPAIYRYFSSKESLLVSMYQHLYMRASAGVDAVLSEGVEGREALERLIDVQLELVTEEPEKIRIVQREERHLPLKEAEDLHATVRQHLRVWTDVLRKARPELGREESEAAVHAVLALINSIALRRKPEPSSPAVRAHLRAMATTALYAGTREALDGAGTTTTT